MSLSTGVCNRKWKLLQPEISVARISCLSSGSFRPKLGLCILFLVVIGCCILIVVPLVTTPSLVSNQPRIATMEITDKVSVEAVALANTEFTKKLYKELIKAASPNDNVILSPFSISTVIAMTYAGAKGQTADQIKTGLALPDDEQVFQGYKQALVTLVSNENFTLDAANKLYVQEGYNLLESYLENAKVNFHADPVTTDFGKSEESRALINQWVEKQTNDKIKDLIKSGVLSALTRLVLVNAIYFKGDWANKFDPKRTTKGDFTLIDGTKVQADMMRKTAEYKATRIKELDAAVLEMPYKGNRLSMLFILPNKDLAQTETNLSTFDFSKLALDFPHKFEVTIPKFKIESSHDLNDPLIALGMKDMFSESAADFSGMSDKNDLYMSAVVQKAFIEVNEEGSEAAAATAGIMMMRAALANPQFNCNKPFLFMIKDNLTGFILFAGKVVDPTKN